MIQTDGNANGITLFLPPDKYNVLVFNYDAKNIGFRNMSKFEEAEAYISSLEDLEACQDEVIPLYVATIRSVEVEGDTEKHKELTLSPFFLGSLRYRPGWYDRALLPGRWRGAKPFPYQHGHG